MVLAKSVINLAVTSLRGGGPLSLPLPLDGPRWVDECFTDAAVDELSLELSFFRAAAAGEVTRGGGHGGGRGFEDGRDDLSFDSVDD